MKHYSSNKIKGFTSARKEAKGFTLVELLVVVAIIAILSVIGLTIFTSAQKNARDARRKADIDAIANAIEVNRSPGTVYYLSLPATTGFSGGVVPCDNNNCVGTPNAAKSNYCITGIQSGSLPPDPLPATPWTPASGVGCPTGWFYIPSTGVVASTTTTGAAMSQSIFGEKIIGFKVCAKLESGDVYCKPSSQ